MFSKLLLPSFLLVMLSSQPAAVASGSVQIYSPKPATPFSNTESKAHLQLFLITRKTILGAPGDDLLLGIVNDLEPGVGLPI